MKVCFLDFIRVQSCKSVPKWRWPRRRRRPYRLKLKDYIYESDIDHVNRYVHWVWHYIATKSVMLVPPFYKIDLRPPTAVRKKIGDMEKHGPRTRKIRQTGKVLFCLHPPAPEFCSLCVYPQFVPVLWYCRLEIVLTSWLSSLAPLFRFLRVCSQFVAPFGSYQALLGTNPIAVGIPRAEGKEPIVLDMATAAYPCELGKKPGTEHQKC